MKCALQKLIDWILFEGKNSDMSCLLFALTTESTCPSVALHWKL